MKIFQRILLLVACVALLGISWLTALTAKPDREKQRELLDQAESYLQDEIYVLAVPILEEAAAYEDTYTWEAEEKLKNAYLHLSNQSGFTRKYTELLDRQMDRKDAPVSVFQEAADYYLEEPDLIAALTVLRKGIEKTGDQTLTDYYESQRYSFRYSSSVYQEAAEIMNGASQVKLDGKWGLANAATGGLIIPCEYDAISTLADGEMIVKKDAVISGIDLNNNRVALCHVNADGFSNFSGNRVWLKSSDNWILADGNFNHGNVPMEDVGLFVNGAAAAKSGGKWGLIGTNGSNWILPAQYDNVIRDDLGRAFSQNAVFVENGGNVSLLIRGKKDFQMTGGSYEDAMPFLDGWAAVKKGGKWGFIDATGSVKIDFQYEDAKSFGGHLAAVKIDGKWGYISLRNEIVIDPVFLDARNFSLGCAPVKTEEGWQFIMLREYQGG